MEWTEMVKKGAEVIGETAQMMTEKVMDKDFRERVAGTVAEVSLNLADTASRTIKKTKHYAMEKCLPSDTKDAYIRELEAQLEEKEKEIQMLKRRLRKKKWNGRM